MIYNQNRQLLDGADQDGVLFEPTADQAPGALAYHERRYRDALDHTPPAGVGKKCHPYLLGLATLGILAGYGPKEIIRDIKAAIPPGNRVVSREEIRDAVNRAMQDTVPAWINPSVRPSGGIVRHKKLNSTEAEKIRSKILSYSTGPVNLDSDEFKRAHGLCLEQMPFACLYPDAFSMIPLLQELFLPRDTLYIGPERMEDGGIDNVRPVEEWVNHFKTVQAAILERVGNTDWNSSTPSAFLLNLGMRYSHIVPNPLTGCFGKTKTGGLSLRCDDSVCGFKYAIVEFDEFDFGKQGEILHCICQALDLPICAVIDSGNRSYHAWFRINNVDSLAAWDEKVRKGLFPTFEVLGADSACANPSRGSRLPGVYRWETSKWQRLLFVSKEGVKI